LHRHIAYRASRGKKGACQRILFAERRDASWPDVAGVISMASAFFSCGLKMQPSSPETNATINRKYASFLSDAETDIGPPFKGDGFQLFFMAPEKFLPDNYKSTNKARKCQQ